MLVQIRRINNTMIGATICTYVRLDQIGINKLVNLKILIHCPAVRIGIVKLVSFDETDAISRRNVLRTHIWMLGIYELDRFNYLISALICLSLRS